LNIVTRLKRYGFILAAAYLLIIGGGYYQQLFAVRQFQHLAVTVLLGVWLALRLARRRGLPVTPLNLPIYACVIVWFASALTSIDPRMALENLWLPLTNLLLFFIMVDLIQGGGEGLLLDTQFLIAALVVLLALAQFGSWFWGWGFGTPRLGWAGLLGADLPLPLTQPRLFVPLGVSTWLAAYTAPLAVLAAAWGWAARRRGARNALWALAAALVAIMLLTYSRGGWISLGAGAAAFAGLQLLRDARLRALVRRFAIPLLVALAVLVAAAAFVLLRLSAESGHSSGDILRFDLWRGALDITRDHPVLGVGAGEFGHAYRSYRDPAYLDNRFSTSHNFYLNTLAETGIVGVAVALALGAALLWAWWRLWNAAETPARRIRLSGALAALIGLGAQSFFDTFTSLPLALLALLLAAYCVTAPRSKADPPLRGSIPAAVVGLILLLGFGAGLVRSDQAQAAFNTSVSAGSLDAAWQAQALDPALRLYDLQIAYVSGVQDDPQAVPLYQHALSLEPTWDTGWINLAALYVRRGEAAPALDALLRADAIDHHNGAILLWARLAESTDSAPPVSVSSA
jgi:O-antigen ligase